MYLAVADSRRLGWTTLQTTAGAGFQQHHDSKCLDCNPYLAVSRAHLDTHLVKFFLQRVGKQLFLPLDLEGQVLLLLLELHQSLHHLAKE